MKLSIVIPVYNVELYIRDCLDSIKNQLVDDVEVIIINDGSIDNSEYIIKSEYNDLLNKDNVRYVTNENKGIAKTRNEGISLSVGEYIAFIDSDDIVSDRYVDSILDAIEYDCDLIHIDLERIQAVPIENNDKISKTDIKIINYNLEKEKQFKECSWFVCGRVYKKDILNEKFFPDNIYYEDFQSVSLIYLRPCTICKIEHTIYFYRMNSNSITNTLTMKHLNSWLVILRTINSLELHDKYKLKLKLKVLQNIYISKIRLKDDLFFSYSLKFSERVRLLSSGLLSNTDYLFCISDVLYKIYLENRLK